MEASDPASYNGHLGLLLRRGKVCPPSFSHRSPPALFFAALLFLPLLLLAAADLFFFFGGASL